MVKWLLHCAWHISAITLNDLVFSLHLLAFAFARLGGSCPWLSVFLYWGVACDTVFFLWLSPCNMCNQPSGPLLTHMTWVNQRLRLKSPATSRVFTPNYWGIVRSLMWWWPYLGNRLKSDQDNRFLIFLHASSLLAPLTIYSGDFRLEITIFTQFHEVQYNNWCKTIR